jgi:hypothetical protein
VTTEELNEELWALGSGAVRLLAQRCTEGNRADILFARATLAGTFSVMAAEKATDASRGLRLLVLLMFEANLNGRYDRHARVSLPTFVACITNERPEWRTANGIPPAMGRLAWELLARLARQHQLAGDEWFALRKLHPEHTDEFWNRLARKLGALRILDTVLH